MSWDKQLSNKIKEIAPDLTVEQRCSIIAKCAELNQQAYMQGHGKGFEDGVEHGKKCKLGCPNCSSVKW